MCFNPSLMRSVQSSFSIMLPFDLYCVLPAAKAKCGQNQEVGCYRRSPRGAQTIAVATVIGGISGGGVDISL